MEKRRFNVSVQAKTINESLPDSNYPIEILATEEEVGEIEALFDAEAKLEESPMVITPIFHHQRGLNEAYDTYLSRIYNMLYELGTLKTKKHIEEMHILSINEAVADEIQN